MNIIASNCVGARMYEIANQQFNNPFMWTIMLPKDFFYLIHNFNNIDFQNITVSTMYWNEYNDNVYTIILDSKIQIIFIHHKYDANAITPIKNGIDLYYNDIKMYLANTWKRRVARMSPKNLVFLGIANKFWNKSDVINFINLKTKFKRVLIVYNNFKDIKNQKIDIIHISNRKLSTYSIAKHLLDNYSLSFI